MRFSRCIDIDAPPEVVWGVWSDIERWPEWTASIRSIEKLSAGSLSVGMRARVRQPNLPTAIWRVTDLQQNRGFSWVSTSPGAHVTGVHTIEPYCDGTRAIMAVIYTGPIALLFGWLTRSLTNRYLELEANGLRLRSEELAKSRDNSSRNI